MIPKFALLDAGSQNLGDEIQVLAARRFLPKVDLHLPREALNRAPAGDTPVWMVMNGWYMAKPGNWPPHSGVVPLLTSVHISQRRPSRRRFWLGPPSKGMLDAPGRAWFRDHGPVGARDPGTRELLERHDIESYYSGCLTLTLPTRPRAPRHDRIVACDLTPPMLAELARRTKQAPITVTHDDPRTQGIQARLARAEQLLDLYAGARSVVTTRLHCALPCLALGTPVLFLPLQRDVERLQPAMDLASWVTARDFLAGGGFDPEEPPPNPARFGGLAEALAREVDRFVTCATAAQQPVHQRQNGQIGYAAGP